jgi:hypothetical protein
MAQGNSFITDLPIRDSSLQLSFYLSNKIEELYNTRHVDLHRHFAR